jgi:hypothetical protein
MKFQINIVYLIPFLLLFNLIVDEEKLVIEISNCIRVSKPLLW